MTEKHGNYESGQTVKFTKEISWTNYGTPRKTLPAGTQLTLGSWRPEGFTAQTENGEWFFVFKEYLADAIIIKKESSK